MFYFSPQNVLFSPQNGPTFSPINVLPFSHNCPTFFYNCPTFFVHARWEPCINKLIIQNCKPVFTKSGKIGKFTFPIFLHLAAAPQAEVKVEIICHYLKANLNSMQGTKQAVANATTKLAGRLLIIMNSPVRATAIWGQHFWQHLIHVFYCEILSWKRSKHFRCVRNLSVSLGSESV